MLDIKTANTINIIAFRFANISLPSFYPASIPDKSAIVKLYVESDGQDVAVFHYVLFALEIGLALGLDGIFAAYSLRSLNLMSSALINPF